MMLSVLTFTIAIILPFFLLRPLWAVLTLVYVSLISPSLSVLPLLILKPLTFSGKISARTRDLLTGASEGLLIVLIDQFRIVPQNFIIAATVTYIFNQLTRYLRGYAKDEIHELVGFLMPIILVYVYRYIF